MELFQLGGLPLKDNLGKREGGEGCGGEEKNTRDNPVTTELSDRPAFEFDGNKKNFGSLDEQIKN